MRVFINWWWNRFSCSDSSSLKVLGGTAVVSFAGGAIYEAILRISNAKLF